MKKTLKSTIFSIILLTIISILFTSCTPKETIKIGYAACLTGRNSELGVSGRNAALLAVEEINKSGGLNGRELQLLVVDDENNPETALKVDKEVVANGAVAIIGHITSGMNQFTLPYANKNNVLLISPTISTPTLTGIDDNFFRLISANNNQAELLAVDCVKNKNFKKIGAVYDLSNSQYSEVIYNNFKAKAQELGAQVVISKPFSSGSNVSFQNIANELIASDVDAILCVSNSMDTAMLCQQLQKAKSNLPVYSPMWALTDVLIKQGGISTERVFISGIIDDHSENRSYTDFKEKYYSKYKSYPTFSSVYSYDAVNMLYSSLKVSKDFKTETIKSNIIKIGRFKGVYDDFYIDKYGDTDRNYYLFTIKDGQFKRVK